MQFILIGIADKTRKSIISIPIVQEAKNTSPPIIPMYRTGFRQDFVFTGDPAPIDVNF
ncbi:hypothetical protein [Candidatus Spongiihabitans sp.]|uniref:hypothetical protein n=1 Tax=Candidatus Spongiihabitans sp. TaxID=3101308 RepID=UPI003C6F37F2